MPAQDLERLVVQLSADISRYEAALRRALGETNRRTRDIESRFSRMSRNINNGFGRLAAGAASAFALIGGVQGFKTLSDAATGIDNALKTAGLSGAELERVYQQLFAAATKNAAPIETLVQLYSRLSLVQKELGVSQDQIVSFSENISLALRAGGTSAKEASGALLQLSQTLGGGVVRAEEFSSIVEGAPTILQAAAAGIREADGSVAKLRQIMLDGKLSSKAFFDGFQAGAPILQEKVAGSILTIDQRLGNLQTALVNAAREFNNSTKANETFGAEIDRVTAFVNGLNFDQIISQLQGLAKQFDGVAGAARSFGEAVGLANVGKAIVGALPGDTVKSYLGGALTIKQDDLIQDRINDAFGESVENAVRQTGDLTAKAIKNSVIAGGEATTPKGGRLPAAPKTKQITLKDYPVTASGKSGSGSGGGGKSKQDDYERDVENIKERTAALQAETAAQECLNGIIFELEHQ